MRKAFPLLAIILFPLAILTAQDAPDRLLIRFSPLYTKGIDIQETRFVESLIQSYLSDYGQVVNPFDDPTVTFERAPDYVVSGSIYLDNDTRLFTLEIYNTKTGITSRHEAAYKSAGDLVLKARSQVEAALASDESDGEEAPLSNFTAGDIAGIWRGEAGIEMVRLDKNGSGVAFFSSGVRMNLSYKIENNILKVKQDSPNTERYYYPLPYDTAKKLAEEAEPMMWELLLYSDGNKLVGVRIAAEAATDDSAEVKVILGAVRDTEWRRSRQP